MRRLKKLAKVLGVLVVVLMLLVGGVVAYAHVAGPGRIQYPSTSKPAIRASTDPAVIARGRALVHGVAHCSACHGTYERTETSRLLGEVPLSGGILINPPFGKFYGSNLTPDRATGLGAWSDAEIARTIRTGVRRNGELSLFMKFSVGPMSDEDVTAIVSYLRSVPPVRHVVPPTEVGTLGYALVAFVKVEPDSATGPRDVPASAEPSVARGRYLADGPASCTGCHTPADIPAGFVPVPGMELAGGDPVPSELEPGKEFAPPNLTPHPTAGIGSWTEQMFVARFRQPRVHAASIMPWENFSKMSDSDLQSIYRYLRTVRSNPHDNGPSYRNEGWSPGG